MRRRLIVTRPGPQFSRSKIRGSDEIPAKVRNIGHNLFAGTETRPLSPLTRNSPYAFCGGRHRPIWGSGEIWGQVWYLMKVLYIQHNLFDETETQSLLLRANRNTNFRWATVPQFRGRVGVKGRVWHLITMGIISRLKPIGHLTSFRSKTPCKFWG